ncbi:hypothetical protein Fmac_026637 [Flemingia macrophylla]|uniref:Uncharacterized protein n=1 Tax=Flemingia macrophylla TaxID=520843 RepID=A0ABD1LFD7_9FABA
MGSFMSMIAYLRKTRTSTINYNPFTGNCHIQVPRRICEKYCRQEWLLLVYSSGVPCQIVDNGLLILKPLNQMDLFLFLLRLLLLSPFRRPT